jgi:biopolymer transport protein ExbB
MEFNIVEELLGFTLIGAEWVLWLLVGLSIVSVAIILERWFYFLKIRINFKNFINQLSEYLENSEEKKIISLCSDVKSVEKKICLIGLKKYQNKERKSLSGAMESFLLGERQRLDRGLIVLGTLGNNAPFIGLFGTVIGIIKAFNDLSLNPEGGPSVVMSGISEALVATAVGLLVAIPAVIAFNAFNRIVKGHISNCQSLIKLFESYSNNTEKKHNLG